MVEADPNSSLIGQQIDRYRVESLLGAGGMGEVYLAEDSSLGRKVALKLLPRHLTTDKLRLHRFKQEARSASALNHPNILTIHEIGEANGHHFIATEFIEGETLRARLARSKLETSAAVEIATQATSALAAAHTKGIVHRDIKPENIMVRDDGYVKVLDFGLAKLTEREPANLEGTTWFDTEPGVVVGTLQYMSPEQVRGQEVDARTDIWSMGAVLYEMVAGKAPYGGDTKSDLIVSILERDPPPLSKYSVNLPPELVRIVHKCLEKDFDDRYQSAKELQVDLRRLLATTTASVAPKTHRRRWPVFAAIVSLLLLVMVALGVWLSRYLSQPEIMSFTTTPLTSFVGWEIGPGLSPDAKFIAFASNRYGQMEIFVLPTTGGDPVRVTNTPADELAARWSPDGRYIAFTSDRGTGTNIYVTGPLGGSERKIAETNIPWIGRESEAVACLGSQPWSPGSTELVFTRMHPSGEHALWKISLQTGAETQLTHPAPGEVDNSAIWSFDGTRIAFHRRRGTGQGSLWLMDVSGGNAEQVLGPPAGGPAWLPDNQRLLFVSGRGGGRELWELDLKSRRTRQVTFGGGGAVLSASVSANGKIAYARYSHQVDLYWGEVGRPHEQHQRLTAHTFNNFGARVSPDGQQVLYFSDRPGNYDLWLLDRRSGSERQFTDQAGADLMADWSPDGKQIVFLSSRGESLQPWVMDVDTGRTRRISEHSHTITFEPHFSGPRWSPDGKAIGFIASSDREETLVIIDPDGSNERSPVPRVNTFDWWRDSSHVIFTRKAADGVMEMLAADIETGKEVVLRRGPTAELVVARDGSAIAYLHSVSHFAMQVIVQRLAPGPDGLPRLVGQPKQLTNGGGEWHVHMGGWSPDAKAVVYTRDADSGDIYMIQNYR